MTAWAMTTCFTWIVGGQPRDTTLAFRVQHPEPPPSDGTRGLVALRLACAEASRYATPPRTVRVTGTESDLSEFDLAATWRVGRFCHGEGISRVAPAPLGSNLRNMSVV